MLLSRVDSSAGAKACWPWLGGIDADGYGRQSGALAHRLVFERLVGPIPVGLELDHTCRTRDCVNPAHLEPVTHAENLRRGSIYIREEVCGRGHAMDERNMRVQKNGRRICRACDRERHRAARDRKKAVVA